MAGSGSRAGSSRNGRTGDGDVERLLRHLDLLAAARGIVLAVSGGPDSTALMHLAALWRAAGGRPPMAVASVDHGLRPEARDEVVGVIDAARCLGFAADRLTWAGETPRRGIPAWARTMRYALLADYARTIGASHIVTAHTLDDQAETVLLRLSRGSGIGGLGGMRPVVDLHGLSLARPLLTVPKWQLVALCRERNWPFIEDPTNADPAYARARWRKLAPTLAREGLTAEGLSRLASRAARADEALAHMAEKVERQVLVGMPHPTRRYDMDGLRDQPLEIIIRVIGTAVADIGAGDRPRLERLERLAADVGAAHCEGRRLRRTLNNCVVTLAEGVLDIAPEGLRRRGVEPRRLQHTDSFPPRDEPLPAASLGNASPSSYIGFVDATARHPDVVGTHSAFTVQAGKRMLSAGP